MFEQLRYRSKVAQPLVRIFSKVSDVVLKLKPLNIIILQIKVLNPNSQKVTTLAGTGRAGFKDGVAQGGQVCCLLIKYTGLRGND